MTTAALSAFSGQVWDSSLGEFISEDHQRMAEILADYNPNLSLVYIPLADRTLGDRYPFAIIERRQGFEPQVIRYLTEMHMRQPQEILAWVFEGDILRQRPQDVLAKIEARELAAQLMQAKRDLDEALDRQDKVAFLSTGGREKKHTVQLSKGRTFQR